MVSTQTIRDLSPDDTELIDQVAQMLVAEFREHHPNAFPTIEKALKTVQESFSETEAQKHISRVALNGKDESVGWIGGIPDYNGNVWELHPLVVRGDCHGLGVGRKLVADLEDQVRARGGVTVTLGTDDENNQTSLGGINLYPDVWAHIKNIKNLNHHPFEFYQKCGYQIVGVLPDANGPGKPDILMGKSMG